MIFKVCKNQDALKPVILHKLVLCKQLRLDTESENGSQIERWGFRFRFYRVFNLPGPPIKLTVINRIVTNQLYSTLMVN